MLQSARQVAADEAEELKHLKEQADHAAQVADAAKALQGILGLDNVARLRMVRGVGDNAFDKLNIAGFDSVEKIAECDIAELADACEVTEQKAKQLRFGANHLINEEKDMHKRAAEFGITVLDDVVQIPGMEEEEETVETAETAETAPEATEEVAAEVVVAEAAGTTDADESAAELA
jgi:hypothetical protein